VRPPAHLLARPYLRPVYDEPEFIVRNVWRRYGGWWDGNPATLKPASERALALELAELGGGAARLAERAIELTAQAGDAGETGPAGDAGGKTAPTGEAALRLAGHLAELAWLAAPQDPAIVAARRRVYSVRADRASSTMARGIFRWAAEEAPDDPDSET
jgi:hypothetical protein